MIQHQTGLPPVMWGTAIIGFGSRHYKYDSGREGDMPIIGFSPRSNAIVFYLSLNAADKADFLQRLGKHRTGKGCIYIKKLSDIDIAVLADMLSASARYV